MNLDCISIAPANLLGQLTEQAVPVAWLQPQHPILSHWRKIKCKINHGIYISITKFIRELYKVRILT